MALGISEQPEKTGRRPGRLLHPVPRRVPFPLPHTPQRVLPCWFAARPAAARLRPAVLLILNQSSLHSGPPGLRAAPLGLSLPHILWTQPC